MEELLIKSHGAKCKLRASKRLIDKILNEDFFYHYIPDVEIGENSVIGAGSVVNKNVESNSLYVGVPARKIKSL